MVLLIVFGVVAWLIVMGLIMFLLGHYAIGAILVLVPAAFAVWMIRGLKL
jgi:hypothetical protein